MKVHRTTNSIVLYLNFAAVSKEERSTVIIEFNKKLVDLFPCPLTALMAVIIVANISFRQGIKLLQCIYLFSNINEQIHPSIIHISVCSHHSFIQTFMFAPAFPAPSVCVCVCVKSMIKTRLCAQEVPRLNPV